MSNPNDDERLNKSGLPQGSELPDWMLNAETEAEKPPEWLIDFPSEDAPGNVPPPIPKRKQPPPVRTRNASMGSSAPSYPPPQPAPPPPPPPPRWNSSSSYSGQTSGQKTQDFSIMIPIVILGCVFAMVVCAGIAGWVNGTSGTDGSRQSLVSNYSIPSVSAGEQYFNQGDYAKAAESLTLQIASDPNNATLYCLRAASYMKLKRFNQALPDATKSINLTSNNADYFLQRAEINAELKQFRNGLADINQAMKLKKPDASWFLYRSYLFSCLHSPKSALIDANKAVSLAPNDAGANEQKAGAHFALNQFSQAIASYTKALALKPTEPAPDYAMRALCYLNSKDYKHAVADAKKALELDPNCAQARDVIANMPSAYQNQVAISDPDYAQPMQSHTAAASGSSGVGPVADKWALLVGLGKFEEKGMNPLKSAKDARDFCKYLTSEANFAPDHVRMLVNEHATLKRVKSELNKFLAHVARPDDLVVIYFSSHGSPAAGDVRGDNYICLYDTQGDDLFSTALEMQSLINVVKNRIISRRILLILDCCFAGNTKARAFGKIGNFDASEIAQGTGQVVLCSSAPNQMSCESVRYENGVFTRQLIEGLRSQGVKTTIDDAFRYTRNAVANEVREDAGLSQTPVMNGAWQGPKMRLAMPPAEPRSVPQSVSFSLEPDDSSN